MDDIAFEVSPILEEGNILTDSGSSAMMDMMIYNSEKEEDEIEEDNNENGEEMEEEEEEEGGYVLRFDGEMNPLDFTEDDAFGIQPYQQFERLEYEALANKKRKQLANPDGEVSVKKPRQEDIFGATFDEMLELMNYSSRRRSRKHKKRGRKRGGKNKLTPEVTRKLGDATLHYAHGRYEEAIVALKEVILIAPNVPEPYHTLGLVYNAMGDEKKAMNFYMIAAHFTPKDSSLWKMLVTWSIKQGNTGQARYCLSKAITADPEDVTLRFHRASLYIELGDYQKAAESYDHISRICPDNVEALKKAAMLYRKCGQVEQSVNILGAYLKNHPTEADLTVVGMLAALHMEDKLYIEALQHIEEAHQVYCSGKALPLYLTVKYGICNIHIGNVEKAEILFGVIQRENSNDYVDLITEVADAYMSVEHHELALKYYLMVDETAADNIGLLHLKIAQCYLHLKERQQSVTFFYKALETREENIDARLTLASLLLDEGKESEAISVLSPPSSSVVEYDQDSNKSESWWLNGKVKIKLSNIYRTKGMTEAFVDTIFPSVRQSLLVETRQQRGKARKRLSKNVLFERVKVLDDHQPDNVFHGFRPIATSSDVSKALRAKKLLRKKATLKEQKKAAALASGVEYKSDDSDDGSIKQTLREPSLPNILKDDEHYLLITDLCKAMETLQRYWEASEIINLTLRLGYNTLSAKKKEELRTLGAQIEYNISNPTHGLNCIRHVVQQHPYSVAAWNRYYKVTSRLLNNRKHHKFLHSMRVKHKDSVPPILIFGHQLTMIKQHQAAAKEYLEAYKLLPENPLINLCAGTALIDLALGLRLHNRHQCAVQGLAFLFNNLRLCENSQESLYNIARAFHHIGLVTLAASYYEKVLATRVKDYPIPKLPNDSFELNENPSNGYCDLSREAAFNLHLIYKQSGAFDLARQVLKDHCTF